MSDWNKLSYEEKQAKARRAEEVLKESGWLFDEVRDKALADILSTRAMESDKREELYRRAVTLEYLREHLAGIANSMTLEAARHDKRKE